MKIRNGFVSNSSSSSFIVELKYLSAVQLEAIKNHFEKVDEVGDEWHIEVSDTHVRGETTMDNFDMRYYMEKLNVPLEHVKFDDYSSFMWDWGDDHEDS